MVLGRSTSSTLQGYVLLVLPVVKRFFLGVAGESLPGKKLIVCRKYRVVEEETSLLVGAENMLAWRGVGF